MAEEPRLTDFTPDLTPPPTNGSHTRRRRFRFPGGITFGVLLGLLVAVNAVSRTQWLNLGRVGPWSRPAIAAGVAGVMAGAFGRISLRAAALSGAVAGVASLWVVYAIVRLSTRVIFVERSITATVAADAALLGVVGATSGALGGIIVRLVRDAAVGRRRVSRPIE